MTSAVAATWTAGGAASGPLHLGWIQSRDQHLRRPVVTPVATGVGAFGFFYACALVARRIPVLDRAIGNVPQLPLLGVSRAKPYELIGSGALPAVKVDGCRRIRNDDLRAYVEGLLPSR